MRLACIAAAILAFGVAGCSDSAALKKAQAEAEAAKTAQAKAEAELARIKAGGEGRVDINPQRAALGNAFNAGDAEAWAKVHASNAFVITETGEVLKGSAEIQKAQAKLFADNPGMKVTANFESTFFPAPNVCVEDGWWRVGPRSDGGATEGRYKNIWTFQDGQWLVKSGQSWVPTKKK